MSAMATCTVRHMAEDVATRVRALRERLNLTQQQVADRARLDRLDITKVETRKNAATSTRIRDGLAEAFDVDARSLRRYLDGELGIDEMLRECRNRSARPPEEGDMGLAIPTANVGMRNLEALAVVHKKRWSIWAIRLAMSGYFGRDDV